MENKTDATLQLLSELPSETIAASPEYLALLGFSQNSSWQVVVKYNGDKLNFSLLLLHKSINENPTAAHKNPFNV